MKRNSLTKQEHVSARVKYATGRTKSSHSLSSFRLEKSGESSETWFDYFGSVLNKNLLYSR